MDLILNGLQNKSVIIEGGNIKIIKKGGIFSTERVKKLGALFVGFIQFPLAGAIAHDSSSNKNQLSPADEIRKLKALLDEGILTEEEFNKKKKELLGI